MHASLRRAARQAIAWWPRAARHGLLRGLLRLHTGPDDRLAVHVAATADELRACFHLLHEAGAGGVTRWHALPTTTVLAATWDGEVVGTLSLIGEGVFGLPLQPAFELWPLRLQPGRVAELAALAIAPRWRGDGGRVLFALLRCALRHALHGGTLRHLVAAVPLPLADRFEALMPLRRLPGGDGTAVGLHLDVAAAPGQLAALYRGCGPRRDLHRLLVGEAGPPPARPHFVGPAPLLPPALLDEVFRRGSRVFERLDARQRVLLHAVYGDEHRAVLPPLAPGTPTGELQRRHQRHALRCPAQLQLAHATLPALVTQASASGLQLLADRPLPAGAIGLLSVHLGTGLPARVRVAVVRRLQAEGHGYGLRVDTPDAAWLAGVHRLACGALPGPC